MGGGCGVGAYCIALHPTNLLIVASVSETDVVTEGSTLTRSILGAVDENEKYAPTPSGGRPKI